MARDRVPVPPDEDKAMLGPLQIEGELLAERVDEDIRRFMGDIYAVCKRFRGFHDRARHQPVAQENVAKYGFC